LAGSSRMAAAGARVKRGTCDSITGSQYGRGHESLDTFSNLGSGLVPNAKGSQEETFAPVYSEKHEGKDTYSHLGPNDLVPRSGDGGGALLFASNNAVATSSAAVSDRGRGVGVTRPTGPTGGGAFGGPGGPPEPKPTLRPRPQLPRRASPGNGPSRRSLADAGLASNLTDVDAVVFGRDVDGSSHRWPASGARASRHFADAQGRTSVQLGAASAARVVQLDESQARRTAGLTNRSDVDQALFGRESGRDAAIAYPAAAGECAGRTSKEIATSVWPFEQRGGHKSFGGVSQRSEVDTVVFRRDLDRSGAAALLTQGGEFAGALGMVSTGGRTPGQKKSFGPIAQRSAVDEALFGRDIDRSAAKLALSAMPEFKGGAGSNTLDARAVAARYHARHDAPPAAHPPPGGASSLALAASSTAAGQRFDTYNQQVRAVAAVRPAGGRLHQNF